MSLQSKEGKQLNKENQMKIKGMRIQNKVDKQAALQTDKWYLFLPK